MPDDSRFVADTNVLVSRFVFQNSVPAQAIRYATSIGQLLVSIETLDKFLALALAGHADFILTGDQDLLILHPFHNIDILTPRQYLDRQQA
jgi:predicted nucleic acid-binding protein